MVDIRFGELRIDTLAGNSGIFAGSNRVGGMRHASKTNQAFGAADGKSNFIADVRGLLRDRDFVDTISQRKHERQ